jgi:hypothetical protein
VSDIQAIPPLIASASGAVKLQDAQHTAAACLLEYDGEVYLHDGYAITLSVVLQLVGIEVPDTYQAIVLGITFLKDRGWTCVKVGQQKAGDVGSTCGDQADHGSDHIYLVLNALNTDEMVVADHQQLKPHFRFASGKGGNVPIRFSYAQYNDLCTAFSSGVYHLDRLASLFFVFVRRSPLFSVFALGTDFASRAKRLDYDRLALRCGELTGDPRRASVELISFVIY